MGWHVDGIKILHCDLSVVESVFTLMEHEFGRETPLAITRGNVHEYLGMTIDFSQPGKGQFSMNDYIKGLVDECPDDLRKGTATTPAANHLFQANVDPNAEKLSTSDAEVYHHLTAKVLYLAKCTCPDLQADVAFLTTRMKSPGIDDYKKLERCI